MTRILTLMLLIACGTASAQQAQAYRQQINARAVPAEVLETFNEQYPFVMVHGWYVTHISYWYNDVSAGWYSDWYGPRNVVVYTYEKPNYYEVEFTNRHGERSRSVYNRYGYWYETRSKLKGLPMVLLEALKESRYAEWKRSTLTERIEVPGWPGEVYRFQVSKGFRSRIIRMDGQGNLIQTKTLDE